ncbi:MAG: hypothetical protein KAJ75_06605 [Alphaproteobacteria bacterium]|nr:hypothetical protein [Alphaproteobacteria bacterium]
MKNKNNTLPELLTVPQFVKRFPAFKIGGIRFKIFNEKENGLYDSGAIVRIGRKVLIDVNAFFMWVSIQNPNNKFNLQDDI